MAVVDLYAGSAWFQDRFHIAIDQQLQAERESTDGIPVYIVDTAVMLAVQYRPPTPAETYEAPAPLFSTYTVSASKAFSLCSYHPVLSGDI